MSFPGWLAALLPAETATTWEQIAPVVPAGFYLGGGTAIAVHLRHRQSRDLDFFFHQPANLDELVEQLRSRGPFAISAQTVGTLNGLFAKTRVQFLQCGIERPERQLEPATLVAGLPVAGLGDLLAMKLNAIAGRAQLRDYYDLMTIEQQTGRTIEEGLTLYLARYQPTQPESAITPILLALGYLDDVADDPFLPTKRDAIARYWQRRQPQILAAIERHGLTPPTPEPELSPPDDRQSPPSLPKREQGHAHELEW